MSLILNKKPGQKILELGCGDNPHPDSDVRVDVRKGHFIDFTCDFNKELPLTPEIGSEGFDAVLCLFAMEHISYRHVPNFVRELHRVLKPGGKAIVTIPNTEAQLHWIQENQVGWDGKDLFEAASEKLFGTQDYKENAHCAYFSPAIAAKLFKDAGFEAVITRPYGERETDLCVEATKAKSDEPEIVEVHPTENIVMPPAAEGAPEELFDKHYFHGGRKVGGYGINGYFDFPTHQVTFEHVMARKPESVLELGCARGYIGKRLEDAGVSYDGLDVSWHCYLTRACDNVMIHDISKSPWPLRNAPTDWTGEHWWVDLCLSLGVLDHIPEKHLPTVFAEMKRTCQRGLHGIGTGPRTMGDLTRCCIKPIQWWREQFDAAGLQSHEVLEKDALEQGAISEAYRRGDGKVKWNIGCHRVMFHHGWTNCDVLDLGQWAQAYGYQFVQCDVRRGIPLPSGTMHLCLLSHFLEHLSYDEGLSLLREIRRCMRPDGVLRIVVPDTKKLLSADDLTGYNEVNDGCEFAYAHMPRLYAMLVEGHAAIYDEESLAEQLRQAGFKPVVGAFRECVSQQMKSECIDMFPAHSLYVDATPE